MIAGILSNAKLGVLEGLLKMRWSPMTAKCTQSSTPSPVQFVVSCCDTRVCVGARDCAHGDNTNACYAIRARSRARNSVHCSHCTGMRAFCMRLLPFCFRFLDRLDSMTPEIK